MQFIQIIHSSLSIVLRLLLWAIAQQHEEQPIPRIAFVTGRRREAEAALYKTTLETGALIGPIDSSESLFKQILHPARRGRMSSIRYFEYLTFACNCKPNERTTCSCLNDFRRLLLFKLFGFDFAVAAGTKGTQRLSGATRNSSHAGKLIIFIVSIIVIVSTLQLFLL